MNRQQMKEAGKQRLLRKPVEPGRTGGQVLDVLLAEEGEEVVKKPEVVPPKVDDGPRLELKEGLKGAKANWTKYPNEIHQIIVELLKEMSEGILYIYMWRMSWGFSRNYCRIGYGRVARETLIRSSRTAQRAMEKLQEKQFVVKCLTPEGTIDYTKDGTLYRVFSPEEIKSGTSDEGISLQSIPVEGCPVSSTYPSNGDYSNGDYSNGDYSNGDYSNGEQDSLATMTIATMTRVDANQDKIKKNGDYSNGDYSNGDYTYKDIKKDIKELSLSHIIDNFYTGIGQTKISKSKRERAEKDIKELREEGYTLEQIAFIVKWTIEDAKNHNKKYYDFKIIKETVGQAMAAWEKEQMRVQKALEAELARQAEEAEREAEEAERLECEKLKEAMNKSDRKELREQANQELIEAGCKQGFILEAAIEAKENEILRRTLSNGKQS